MTSGTDILDAVVIGAGWAGLGVSHALTQSGLRHRVLERGRIGETWRTQRWDSFRINTPNIQTIMPGDTYVGPATRIARHARLSLLCCHPKYNRLMHQPTATHSVSAVEPCWWWVAPSRGARSPRTWSRQGGLCFLQRAGSAGCRECTEVVTSVSGWFLAGGWI